MAISCWSNYAIFQRRIAVQQHYIPHIQKTFDSGIKVWPRFFTGYT